MKLISVIVPVYNIEKYIGTCIESISNQTYENLEIILVDDGSTDCSSELCDKYAEIDKRIIVIHKQNGGLVSARKAGLGHAHGEYCCFVDGDDVCNEKMLQKLYMACENENATAAFCNFNFYDQPCISVKWGKRKKVDKDHIDFLDKPIFLRVINWFYEIFCCRIISCFRKYRMPKMHFIH